MSMGFRGLSYKICSLVARWKERKASRGAQQAKRNKAEHTKAGKEKKRPAAGGPS
jgi:hypothetical protein